MKKSSRRFLITAGVVLGVGILAVALLAVKDALHARAELKDARRILGHARSEADALNIAGLHLALNQAGPPIERARIAGNSLPLRLLGGVPIVGRSVHALQAVADAARLALDAGRDAVEGAALFPVTDGRPQFGLVDGRVAIDRWAQAASYFDRANSLAVKAARRAESATDSWIPSFISSPAERIRSQTQTLQAATRRISAVAHLLPPLLGANGPKRYLIVLQNLAEARATGGLLGGYVLLETSAGTLRLGASGNNFSVLETSKDIPMPDWFAHRYDRFGSRHAWLNSNMEPHFPVTAQLIAGLFEAKTRTHVDGVIAIDPYGVKELLEVTGPVPGPNGVTLDADTIAKLVMHDAYIKFPQDQSGARKEFFLDAAGSIFSRLLKSLDARAAARTLGQAVSGRHIMLWSRDNVVEESLLTLGAAGVFRSPGGSLVGVVTQNEAGNKIDYFLHRTIDLTVWLHSDGSARFLLKLTLDNRSPSAGLPQYVIGPNRIGTPPLPPNLAHLKAGEHRVWVNIFLPPSALPEPWIIDGRPSGQELQFAPDAAIVSRMVEVPASTTSHLLIGWSEPEAYPHTGRSRPYAIDLIRPPGANPDVVRLKVLLPRGYRTPTGGISKRPNEFDWSGTSDRDVHFVIDVERPLWRRFSDLFTRRVSRRSVGARHAATSRRRFDAFALHRGILI